MQLDCPKCGSENSQKLSLAVEGGTFSSKSLSIGIGSSSVGAGAFGASSKGASKSTTAEKFAAPEKAPVIRGFIAIMILAGLASLYFGNIAISIGFSVGLVASVLGLLYNLKSFPGELADWESKYLCFRCSEVFLPASNDAGEE